MDCIFCKEKDTVAVEVIAHSDYEGMYLYRAECGFCGAQGQSHKTAEAAAQKWQRLAGYEEALNDILHGPCAAPGWTEQKHRQLLEQTAHDALYGPDDTDHVGNWKAMEGKTTCIVCGRAMPGYCFESLDEPGVCVDCTH